MGSGRCEKAQKGFATLEQKAMDTADKLRVCLLYTSESEIKFIHEADTETKKQELFKKVRLSLIHI